MKRRNVKKVVMKLNPVIFFIQETKLETYDNRIIRDVGGVFLSKGIGVEAAGSAEGLLTLWNEDVLTIKDCISSKWGIILVGMLNNLKKEVVWCNV